jgi:hypothetical protein
MKKGFTKLRVYLRKIQIMRKALASEETMIWIWVGVNPVGHDWSLGSASLYPLEEALRHYERKLRRANFVPEAVA